MKILIAEDDRVTRALLTRWVERWGYEAIVVGDGAEALDCLLKDPSIQLAVLDWMMPGEDGPEVCRKVRESRPEPYCYMTLLTAKTETDDIVAGLAAGADDYIAKPCHPLELEIRLGVGRRLVELQTSLIAARERLRFEATHDALTGLFNRRAIVECVEAELRNSARQGRPLSVVMMDIDFFKSINDGFGHAAGDKVLREVARRVGGVLREDEHFGRYGGEEFLAVLPGCTLSQGRDAAERMRRALSDAVVELGSQQLLVTASLGIACHEQFARGDAESLMRAADLALYRSKEAGRNRSSVAELPDFGRQSLPVTLSVFPSKAAAP